MAFYLHSAEVDKARAIVERALKTISFRFVCQFIGVFKIEIEVLNNVSSMKLSGSHL